MAPRRALLSQAACVPARPQQVLGKRAVQGLRCLPRCTRLSLWDAEHRCGLSSGLLLLRLCGRLLHLLHARGDKAWMMQHLHVPAGGDASRSVELVRTRCWLNSWDCDWQPSGDRLGADAGATPCARLSSLQSTARVCAQPRRAVTGTVKRCSPQPGSGLLQRARDGGGARACVCYIGGGAHEQMLTGGWGWLEKAGRLPATSLRAGGRLRLPAWRRPCAAAAVSGPAQGCPLLWSAMWSSISPTAPLNPPVETLCTAVQVSDAVPHCSCGRKAACSQA